MFKPKKFFGLDQPLTHADHHRPKTRRDFIAQGFHTGAATVVGSSILGTGSAYADLSHLDAEFAACGIEREGNDFRIPFICFDLAGGANISGSNVLVGGRGGQMDFLDTNGYMKQGLPSNMLPSSLNPDPMSDGTYINTELGLAFHADSGFLRGILEKTDALATRPNINGAVFAARSENDTGNNPHNPMFGIAHCGARGALMSLCGSRTSLSGGNSMAPAALIDNAIRPTKVDRPSDVTGLVDVGDLIGLLSEEQIVAVMESMYRLSDVKMAELNAFVDRMQNQTKPDPVVCNYLAATGLADKYADPSSLDPLADQDILDIFTNAAGASELDDREFRKTASIMKMVIGGYAGAGTITMGGYDYHTGDRATGEMRDLRAGRCMGACLEYARRVGKPLMMYVYSDGSVFSNGAMDNTQGGRGKGVWTGDSQQTAGSFFLVYNPGGKPVLRNESSQQIGYMRASGDVETSSSPVANNVNLLVQSVMLNYLALHGMESSIEDVFLRANTRHGLGNSSSMDRLTAFGQLPGFSNETNV